MATCQDGTWEDAEFCGYDAYVTTGAADMNHDCFVDGLDASLLYLDFAGYTDGLSADLNGDGFLNIADLVLFTGTLYQAASPCTESGMGKDGCTGSLALSLSTDPLAPVSEGTLPAGVHWVYVVASGMQGARYIGFGLETSSNVTILSQTTGVPGSPVRECDGGDHHAYLGMSLNDPIGPEPIVVAEAIIQLTDTQPAWLALSGSSSCGESRMRWAPSAHDRSHDFVSSSNLAINGASLPAGVSTCSETEGPTVVDAAYLNEMQLRVFFDEPLDATTAEVSSHYEVAVYDDPATLVMAANATVQYDAVVLDLARPLTAGVLYRVTVTGVEDVAGNPMGSPNSAAVRADFPRPYQLAIPHLQLYVHNGLARPDTLADRPPYPDQLILYRSDFQNEVDPLVPDAEGWVGVDRTDAGDPDFAGDFAKLHILVTDLDPCRTNPTPQMTFVDDGTPPSNAPMVSTGGATSPSVQYGVPGWWVVNAFGGVSFGSVPLRNEIWSPPFEWDFLGGAYSEPPDMVSAYLRFDVWEHLPLPNGLVYTWAVRSSTDEGLTWTPWRSHDLLYYSPDARYARRVFEITGLLATAPTTLQVSLGVWDVAAAFHLPGGDATPSPTFDSVQVGKYAAPTPLLSAHESWLLQDGFPYGGSIDASTQASRAQLGVRLDGARLTDLPPVLPQEHFVVNAVTTVPGAVLDLSRLTMVWRLEMNPLFDPVREWPSGAYWSPPNTLEGRITAVPYPFATVAGGMYWFPLPDDQLFFPGEEFRYYVEAYDSDGRYATLPRDIVGFEDGEGYAPLFTVRALPAIADETGTQPDLLVVNTAGHREEEAALRRALFENDLHEGIDYDMYTVQAPGLARDNGLGTPSGHGANADQLANYSQMLYVTEHRPGVVMSDGSGSLFNDLSDDYGILEAWEAQPAPRCAIFFGQDLCSGNEANGAAGQSFNQNVLGVEVLSDELPPATLGLSSTRVWPMLPAFSSEYAVEGACVQEQDFDWIRPAAGAQTAHRFLDYRDQVFEDASASVLFERDVAGHRKTSIVFSHSLSFSLDSRDQWGDPLTSRALLLGDVLAHCGHPTQAPATGAAPTPLAPLAALSAHPNPFNPSTTVSFVVGRRGVVVVQLFDLRGRLVRELFRGSMEPGPQTLLWDGCDDRGVALASGNYLLRASAAGVELVRKVVLLK